MFLEKWWPRFPVLVFFLNCLMSPKKKWRMTEHYKHTILETCMGIDDPYVKKPRWRRKWNAISKMIKNGLAEGMVTRKLCVEVLDLVLTSFQTSFFSAPTVSKVQITDMLLLSTSFFSYPLPRSHRQRWIWKKKFPSTSYSFLFQIKAAAHIATKTTTKYWKNHVSKPVVIFWWVCPVCLAMAPLFIQGLPETRNGPKPTAFKLSTAVSTGDALNKQKGISVKPREPLGEIEYRCNP